ncbi:MAG: ATPase domain-containing protein [Rhodoferax sp.]|uniref:ATPase domain-containing protein n=2 Tax=Rhodoferax sp. TaxID=50421 RepID=UPI002726F535|nr:ATPase domain-containing protein [Rhodoferax sp.]MDO9143437.1 ATPase domain-containing protein [Rhodoferax sp.]MDP3863547.1 ATPase domain-containing protein [Rhodoferax sp.]
MTKVQSHMEKASDKALTGIAGFDDITGGGLPRGRTTLLVGGAGAGKTVMALQFLVHGARHCKEPGIFVAFEECAERILTNANSFGWDIEALMPKKLFIMNAQPSPGLVQSGDFDLGGMLAALELQTRAMRAQRIVLDALDVVMALLPDLDARRREIYRLHEWLLAHQMTGLITLKADALESKDINPQALGFMQFMVDCNVILNHGVVHGISERTLRVQKYRGSSFDEDESPFVIGNRGLEVRPDCGKRLRHEPDADGVAGPGAG